MGGCRCSQEFRQQTASGQLAAGGFIAGDGGTRLWVTWLGCLGRVFGVLAGVMIGIALSPLWLIAVTTRPQYRFAWAGAWHRGLAGHLQRTRRRTASRIAVVRFDGDLFFATADALEDRIRDVIHSSSRLDGLVLDC